MLDNQILKGPQQLKDEGNAFDFEKFFSTSDNYAEVNSPSFESVEDNVQSDEE